MAIKVRGFIALSKEHLEGMKKDPSFKSEKAETKCSSCGKKLEEYFYHLRRIPFEIKKQVEDKDKKSKSWLEKFLFSYDTPDMMKGYFCSCGNYFLEAQYFCLF